MNRHVRRIAAVVLISMLVLALGGAPSLAETEASLVYTQIALSSNRITMSPRDAGASLYVTNEEDGHERILWESSDPGVADYDSAARSVVPKSESGRATITAKGAVSGVSASCDVIVRSVSVTSVKFNRASGSLAVHTAFDMNKLLTVLPQDASYPNVSWFSSNQAVAAIDENGIVTVLRDGSTNITARSIENPAKSASFKLTGTAVRVTSIALNETNVTKDPSQSFELTATVKPSNATFGTVTYTSDNEAVATVDEDGKVLTHAPGKAIITASADLGRASTRMAVRVRGGNMQTVKISATGDVVLGGDKKVVKKADKPIGDGLTSMKRFAKFYSQFGASYFFDGVKGVLSQDDLTVINLEGTITKASKPADKTYAFKAPPEYAYILQLGSVEVANLANNHSMDYFTKGYNDTKKYLQAAGISSIGFGTGGILTRNVNGVKIGFASFNIPVSKGTVASAINTLRKTKKCQIVIAQFHWSHSKEWTNKVYAQEKTLARYAVSKGADLVVGHHKHQVSAIERYKGKMIAYDVGNFVAMVRNSIDGKYLDKGSMIYQQKFNIFEDGYVEVCDPNIVPVMISDSMEVVTGNPRVVDGAEGERILNIVRAYSPSSSVPLVKYDSSY